MNAGDLRTGAVVPEALLLGVSHKMYLGWEQTRAWLDAVRALCPVPNGVELFILPTFPSLQDARELLAGSGVRYGAQNCWHEAAGPMTGEVSPAVLAEMGCRFVAVGHAERRRLFAEDDALVARKATAVIEHGMLPVLCVGETHKQPDDEVAAAQVIKQLQACLHDVPDGPLVIAYEPVWAIGADRPAPTRHIRTVAAAIRQAVAARTASIPVLYGGTAGPGTLTELFDDPDSGRASRPLDGLFAGRRVHQVSELGRLITEASRLALTHVRNPIPEVKP